MGKHTPKKSAVNWPEAIIVALKANIIAYMLTAIFIIGSSILLTYTNLSQSIESWIMVIGAICSSFLAGYDTAKVEQKNGYKWGCIGGTMYLIIFVILAMLLSNTSTMNISYMLTLALCVLVSSSVAGMFAVNGKKN